MVTVRVQAPAGYHVTQRKRRNMPDGPAWRGQEAVDYVVTSEMRQPVEAPGLDGLQQEGVAALLDRQLGLVEGVAGPGGSDIDVLDYRITVHPEGAKVMLAVEAPALAAAEEAGAAVLDELLGECELLAGWSVANSEVQITEDEFNQSLAAADRELSGGEAESALEAAVEEALEGATRREAAAWHEAADGADWQDRLIALGEQLAAFDVDSASDPAKARLAAGALLHAVRVVTDEIFYDEMALAINNASADAAVGLLVLEELPPCYADQYDSVFARGFLLASSSVAQRLVQPNWVAPRSIAEGLALRLFINEAQVLLDAVELMSWAESELVFAEFVHRTMPDTAHADLYDVSWNDDEGPRREAVEADLRSRGLAFEQWFEFEEGKSAGLHPYLRQHG